MDILQRALGASGLLAAVVFTILTIVAGALTPGYIHATERISALGSVGSPAAPIQNLAFILTGLLVIAFAVGLHRGLPPPSREGFFESKVGPAFVIVMGIGLLGAGIVQCDPGCAGSLRDSTGSLRDSTHLVMLLVWIVGGIFGILFIARRLDGHSPWRKVRAFSLLIGYSVVGFSLFFVRPLEMFLGDGTMERVLIGLPFLWVAVMGTVLLIGSPRRE